MTGGRTTSEQSKRLFRAVAERHAQRGWRIGARTIVKDGAALTFSSSRYYGFRNGRPVNLSSLPNIDLWMEWEPGSAEDVALRGLSPRPLEKSAVVSVDLKSAEPANRDALRALAADLIAEADDMTEDERGRAVHLIGQILDASRARRRHRRPPKAG